MSRPYSGSETLTLYPSGYTDNNNYLTVTNETRAYTSSSDTSQYATLTLSTNGQTGYVYFTFTVPTIPSGATISNVTCSARLRASNSNRVINCAIRLYNGTTANGNGNSIGNLNTTSTGYLITNDNAGSWTTSTISNIRLRIEGTRNSSSNTSIKFYGADLVINYSISGTEYEVSVTNNASSITTVPSTTQYVFQGGTQEIYIRGASSLDSFNITDNSTNVKSSLTTYSSIPGSTSMIPSSLNSSSGTVTNTNNGLTDETSDTYAQCGGQSGQYLIYNFDTSSIPSNATITSVTCIAKCQHTHSNTAYGSVQLYTGSTAKGTASTFRATTTVTINAGTWTRSELNSARIRIGNTYTGGTTTYYTRFYGATLTVEYTIPENGYKYTISNISADHAIVITSNDPSQTIYIKVNGSWVACSKVYKKVNGSWVEQSDLSNVFSNDTIYIKV